MQSTMEATSNRGAGIGNNQDKKKKVNVNFGKGGGGIGGLVLIGGALATAFLASALTVERRRRKANGKSSHHQQSPPSSATEASSIETVPVPVTNKFNKQSGEDEEPSKGLQFLLPDSSPTSPHQYPLSGTATLEVTNTNPTFSVSAESHVALHETERPKLEGTGEGGGEVFADDTMQISREMESKKDEPLTVPIVDGSSSHESENLQNAVAASSDSAGKEDEESIEAAPADHETSGKDQDLYEPLNPEKHLGEADRACAEEMNEVNIKHEAAEFTAPQANEYLSENLPLIPVNVKPEAQGDGNQETAADGSISGGDESSGLKSLTNDAPNGSVRKEENLSLQSSNCSDINNDEIQSPLELIEVIKETITSMEAAPLDPISEDCPRILVVLQEKEAKQAREHATDDIEMSKGDRRIEEVHAPEASEDAEQVFAEIHEEESEEAIRVEEYALSDQKELIQLNGEVAGVNIFLENSKLDDARSEKGPINGEYGPEFSANSPGEDVNSETIDQGDTTENDQPKLEVIRNGSSNPEYLEEGSAEKVERELKMNDADDTPLRKDSTVMFLEEEGEEPDPQSEESDAADESAEVDPDIYQAKDVQLEDEVLVQTSEATDGDDDADDEDEDILEDSSQGTGDSSNESSTEAVWPAEILQEVPSEPDLTVDAQTEKKAVEEVQKVTPVNENSDEDGIESLHIAASAQQDAGKRDGLNASFIEQYLKELASERNQPTKLPKRRTVAGAALFLLWPSCFWYFGLPFLKISLIIVMVMILSKNHGILSSNANA